ncbi:hypothetical protein F5Y09DRAFT_323534 [Xylaria sp. FL1042]|nr:hypothetical protein F5Y09DRAFT_323534 [Xylaria sp. FL1042]
MRLFTSIVLIVAGICLSHANSTNVSTNVSTNSVPTPRWYPMQCWTYGERFAAYYTVAEAYVLDACNKTLGNRNYTEHQKATACYNIAWNKRVDFTVALKHFPPRIFTSEECSTRMLPIVAICPRGGRRVFHDWKLKADPNRGVC